MFPPSWLPALIGCAAPPESFAPPALGFAAESDAEVVDVVIVGAGPAGLAAAIEATEAGAEVAVLEREPAAGGALRYAGSLMLMAGTPEQAEAGIEDSPETLLAEWEAMTGGDPEDPWVRALAERAVPDVHDWLIARGLPVKLGPYDDASSGAVPRLHTSYDGADVVDTLAATLPEGVLRLERTVDGLIERGGRIVGVRWHGERREGRIHATAVVMATGGFLRDLDRVRAARPELADVALLHASGPGADGQGLGLLEPLGAASRNQAAIALYLHGSEDPARPGEEVCPTCVTEGIWVDAEGRRFTDDGAINSLTSAEDALEASGMAWLVLDGPIVARCRFRVAHQADEERTVQELVEGGAAFQADDLASLADTIGADALVLTDTVAAFNAYTHGEAQDPWRQRDREPPSPIDEPPYTAVRLQPAVAKQFGGVAVDLSGRVLDPAGAPFPGLFASGELTGMAGGSLVGHTGFTGSLTAVLLSGRVAGLAAAEEALAAR